MCLKDILRQFTKGGLPAEVRYQIESLPQGTEEEKRLERKVGWIKTEGRRQIDERGLQLGTGQPDNSEPVNVAEALRRAGYTQDQAELAGIYRALLDFNAEHPPEAS